MLDIKGDIEKKKAEKESKKAVEPAEEKKPSADEKLKEDFKTVVEILEKPYIYNISILDIKSFNDSFWFELYDKEKDKSHTMSYCECDCGFKIETDFDYEENELLENFIDEHRSEYCDCGENLFRFENAPTIIYGFGYDGRHIDGRCYREGMALKFFGDLVCDYLNEPRIERVY